MWSLRVSDIDLRVASSIDSDDNLEDPVNSEDRKVNCLKMKR